MALGVEPVSCYQEVAGSIPVCMWQESMHLSGFLLYLVKLTVAVYSSQKPRD